ncbi:MAG: replication initiation factor domain-containing protein [Burkholderiales bacterium]
MVFLPSYSSSGIRVAAKAESGAVAAPQARLGDADASAPRTVIRGESPVPAGKNSSSGAFVDYLNASFPIGRLGKDPAHAFFVELIKVVGDRFGGMVSRGRGLHGYLQSFQFERGGVQFAYGGQRGTGLLSIPGEGCALIPDWPALVGVLRDGLIGRVTRWDGAIDNFEGHYSVDRAVSLYLSGAFNAGGRPPRCNQQGNWLEPDGNGRTLYLGRRRNGKLLRVYEKGKQLGVPDSPWTRWEVELHNRDRVIPWEAVLNPAPYIAGSFPALEWVSENGIRIETLRRTDSASYQHLIKHGRLTYGPLINVMLEREGCAERVVEKLRRGGAPKRLALTQFLGVHEEDK